MYFTSVVTGVSLIIYCNLRARTVFICKSNLRRFAAVYFNVTLVKPTLKDNLM